MNSAKHSAASRRPAAAARPARKQRRNKEALMKVLGPLKVTNDRMDEVANYYRFRPQKGELWPTKPAEAYAVVDGGKIKEIVVTEPGSGYNTPPKATIDGFKNIRLEAKIKYDKDLKKNGGIESVEITSRQAAHKNKVVAPSPFLPHSLRTYNYIPSPLPPCNTPASATPASKSPASASAA